MLKLADQQDFFGYHFTGRTFDCGSKRGFIEANVAFAMLRSDMGEEIYHSVKELLANHESKVKAA
jgi:UTP--glucose-1-phosphate uridylyltransferase